MTLADRLRKIREKRGLSQQNAAEQLHILPSTLSNYERGHRHPDAKMLALMTKLYNTNADYLLGLTNNDEPHKTPSDEKDFFEAISDPELLTWWEELPKNKEEELRRLREMWKIMQQKDD